MYGIVQMQYYYYVSMYNRDYCSYFFKIITNSGTVFFFNFYLNLFYFANNINGKTKNFSLKQ